VTNLLQRITAFIRFSVESYPFTSVTVPGSIFTFEIYNHFINGKVLSVPTAGVISCRDHCCIAVLSEFITSLLHDHLI